MPRDSAKCRRVGCTCTWGNHDRLVPPFRCISGICACEGFVDAAPRSVGPAEQAYRDAYERGIRRGAPGLAFGVFGRVGAVLGGVARVHAVTNGAPITGAELLRWIEQTAFEFRRATADAPQYWSGWQPFAFAKWINMRGALTAQKESGRQPLAPRRDTLQRGGTWKPRGAPP